MRDKKEGMDDLITIVHQAGKIARLETENERLRAENKDLVDSMGEYALAHSLKDIAIEQLRAEIERLNKDNR